MRQAGLPPTSLPSTAAPEVVFEVVAEASAAAALW